MIFVSLRELLATCDEAGIAPADGDSFLDRIGIEDLMFAEGQGALTATLTLSFRDEIGFSVPGASALGLYLGKTGNPTTLTVQVIYTNASVTIKLVNIALTLRLPPAVLKPVTPTSDGFQVKTLADGSTAPYEISLSGINIGYTPGGDFSIDAPGGPAITLAPAMIGDSGVVIESDDITLHFDRNAPPPSGQSPGFQGIHIARAVVHLPKDLSVTGSSIAFTDASIGSGGFSGTIDFDDPGLNWDATQEKYNGTLVGSLAGFAAGIRKIELRFLQNVMQKGSLQLEAFFPYVDKRLGIELRLASSGDFLFALSSPQSSNADPDVVLDNGVIHLKQPDVLEATLESIAIERQANDVAIRLSGSIRPLLGGIDWPEVGVKALIIHADGRVSVGGGWIDLPQQKGAELFGFPLEIRQVGFGTEANQCWVGFSGGVKLVDGLPIGGAVEGLRIKWDPTNPAAFDIDLKGIAVNLDIPEVLTLSGHVAMYRENGKQWFQGGVKVTLHPLTCTLDAQLLVGRTPTYSFFYIFLEAALPVGIPLGSTSLALYGMGGLFGYNVRPDRHDGEPWYAGWYKRSPEGPTDSSKWTDEENNLAFGATVTLGTLSDNGMAVNARVLLILLIPGPVIMIDGRANLMRDRKTLLTGDPLFKTLAVIDGRAGTMMFDIEPHYLYPEDGQDRGNVIDLNGVAEGYFDFNHPERWYVNVGVRDPKEKRIRATLIKLFKATSYLMLNNQRVALGASVSIDVHYDYGPVGLALGAWFDADAELVFRPLQLTASVGLHGRAELKAVGLALRIELDATAQLTTPRPYTFSALLHAKADLPWPLPDIEVNIPYEYKQPRPSPVTIPLQGVNVVTLKGPEFWDTGDSADPKLVPLDGRTVIVFAKGMHDDALIGGNSQPAGSETSGDLTFDYRLTGIRLEKLVNGSWEVRAACPQAGIPRKLAGMWLPMTNDATPCAKLMLDVKNPFDGVNNTTAAYAEGFVARHSGYPGVYEVSDFEAVPPNTVFNGTAASPYMHDGLAYDPGGLTTWYGGVRVVDAATITAIAGKVASWPQRHALFIPQRWGLVTGGGGSAGGSGGSGGGGTLLPKILRITLPAMVVAQVRLDVTTAERVTVTAHDASGVQLDRVELAVPGNRTAFDTPQRVQLTLTGTALSYILVDGSVTCIFAIRYLSMDPATSSGRINTQNQQDTQRWSDEETLLDPNSTYRLVVETAVDASRGSTNTAWPTEVDAGAIGPSSLPSPIYSPSGARYAFEYMAYFRTEGPPGFLSAEIDRQVAANAPNLPSETGNAKAPASLVRTLRTYVRSTTPADGARPVYRRYDLLVHFNESYVQRMYSADGNRTLTLTLTDRNGAPPRVLSGGTTSAPQWTTTQFSSAWDKQSRWLPTQSDSQWMNTVADAKWLALSANPPQDDSLCVSISGPPLAADSGYTAVLRADPDTNAVDTELYRFAFTTSRYANFAHQVHEFDGRVWDSDQGRDIPLATLTGAEQSELDNAAKSGKPQDFDTLCRLFQIAQRPLPEALEITLLHDAGRRWGFLFESPEPLEAVRTHVRSLFLPQSLPPSTHSGPLRIRDVNRGDHSGVDYNSEWIDLIVIDPTALGGWRLEHLLTAGATTFIPLLTFTRNDPLYPGQIVRVHAGAAPITTPDDGALHVYAAQNSANAQWLLNPTGDTLRLIAPYGSEHSVFGMLPDWVDVDCYWVWNSDRTRAFILPFHRAQGCLTAMIVAMPAWLQQLIGVIAATPMPGLFIGAYRFELSYLLDASAQDVSLPILSVGGRTNPEAAVVQISTR